MRTDTSPAEILARSGWKIALAAGVLVLLIGGAVYGLTAKSAKDLTVQNLDATTLQNVSCSAQGNRVTASGATFGTNGLLAASVSLTVKDSQGNAIATGQERVSGSSSGWSVVTTASGGQPSQCLVGITGVPIGAIVGG